MDTIIELIHNTDTEVQKEALNKLLAIAQRSDLISLKSLIENKTTLTEIYNSHSMSEENKRVLADILSSVYMLSDERTGLAYRKLGNVIDIGSFGHQFVKKVLGTINKETEISETSVKLIIDGLNFLFSHNCEVDAVDFLLELGLIEYVNYFDNSRAELYLLELKSYLDVDHILFDFYRRKRNWVKLFTMMINLKGTNTADTNEYMEIQRIANDRKKMFNIQLRRESISHEEEVRLSFDTLRSAFLYKMTDFYSDLKYVLGVCKESELLQILFISSRCNIRIEEEMLIEAGQMTEKAAKIINNGMLPAINAYLHKDLQVIEPFEIGRFLKGVPKIDKDVTLKDFIPVCISNAFVHFGFGYDSLLFTKEHEYNVDLNVICEKDIPELMTVISMLGLVKRNKNENAKEYATTYDDLLETFAFSSGFSYKKSGALLAYALSQNSYDVEHSLFALLVDDLNSECSFMNICSLIGIQHLYFDKGLEMACDAIEPLMYNKKIETVGISGFTLGSVFCGSMKPELIDLLSVVLVERREESSNAFYLSAVLGYALLFLGKKDRISPYEEFMKEADVLNMVRGFAYLGTGRTDILEELVHYYKEIDDKKDIKDTEEIYSDNIRKSVALLSMALISMNDHTSRNMAKSFFINLLATDKTGSTPLPLALLYASEPDTEVIDALGRSINTPNPITSILALAIVGAGTNNTRITTLLQQQYAYFKKSKLSSMLKIAQGIVCLGKGTLTLSPMMFEKNHIDHRSIANLYATCLFFLGDNYPLVEKYGFMFTLLASSINNKFVVSMDTNLDFLNIYIRIGRPVHTNSMAGKKKNLSAVVVHESPVIVQCDERADIYEEENRYMGYCEDVVIVDVLQKK